jgi:hypothetical protein
MSAVRLRALRLVPGLLATALVAGCGDARGDVAAWLTCEECPVELAAVVAHGDAALEPLVVALYRGPSWPQQQNFLAQVREEYRLAKDAEAALPAGVSQLSDSLVVLARALEDLISAFQLRSAWAIRALDTPRARAGLRQAAVEDSAYALGWRNDVDALVALLDVDEPVTAVSVRGPSDTLGIGLSEQVSAVVHGPVTVSQQVIWSSSAAAIVTVSATGELTRLGPGPVTVSACAAAAPAVCGRVAIHAP